MKRFEKKFRMESTRTGKLTLVKHPVSCFCINFRFFWNDSQFDSKRWRDFEVTWCLLNFMISLFYFSFDLDRPDAPETFVYKKCQSNAFSRAPLFCFIQTRFETVPKCVILNLSFEKFKNFDLFGMQNFEFLCA